MRVLVRPLGTAALVAIGQRKKTKKDAGYLPPLPAAGRIAGIDAGELVPRDLLAGRANAGTILLG